MQHRVTLTALTLVNSSKRNRESGQLYPHLKAEVAEINQSMVSSWFAKLLLSAITTWKIQLLYARVTPSSLENSAVRKPHSYSWGSNCLLDQLWPSPDNTSKPQSKMLTTAANHTFTAITWGYCYVVWLIRLISIRKPFLSNKKNP